MSENALVTDAEDPDESTDAVDDDVDTDHLDDVEPGAGCTEIWEHLSERRAQASDD